MRSRFALVLVLAVAVGYINAPPAFAEDSDPHSIALHVYGAFSPGSAGYGSGSRGEMWAYGGAIQWGLSERWAVSIDASQFSRGELWITPIVGGLTYRPATPAKVTPTFEGGFGLYRLEEPGGTNRYALGSSGYPRDQFSLSPQGLNPIGSNVAGGFVGAGAEGMLTNRLGLGGGVRIHGWADRHWSGMLTLRTGLLYRF